MDTVVPPFQGWCPGGWLTQGGAPRKLGTCPGLSSSAPLGLGAPNGAPEERLLRGAFLFVLSLRDIVRALSS